MPKNKPCATKKATPASRRSNVGKDYAVSEIRIQRVQRCTPFFRECVHAFVEHGKQHPTWPYDKDAGPLIGSINQRPHIRLVASIGDQKAGVLFWSILGELATGSVYVVPDARGKGVATALRTRGLAEAKVEGVRRVMGVVDAENLLGTKAMHPEFHPAGTLYIAQIA